MLYVIYAISIAVLLYSRKNFKYAWIYVALLLSVLSITAKTYSDVDGYTSVFEMANAGGISLVAITDWPLCWLILCKLVGLTGLNYRGMIIILIFSSSFLYHTFAKKHVECEAIFWGLFLLFPAIVHVVQIRFFLGTAILLQGVKYLVSNEKRWILKYLAVVVCASLIHSSCIIFAMLILTVWLRNKKPFIIIMVSVIAIIAVTALSAYIPQIASLVIDSARMRGYFYEGADAMTKNGTIKVFLLWLVNIVLVVFCMRFNKRRYYNCDKMELSYDSFALTTVCLCGICIPLLSFDSNFFRILEIGYIVSFVSISNCWSSSLRRIKAKKTTVTVEVLILSVLCIYFLYYATSWYAPYDGVIKQLFDYQGIVPIIG